MGRSASQPARPPAPAIELRCADTPPLVEAARAIFREYQKSLAVDLCFQGFDAELAGLPGDYAAPGGQLLLAFVDGRVAGCGALRRCGRPAVQRRMAFSPLPVPGRGDLRAAP